MAWYDSQRSSTSSSGMISLGSSSAPRATALSTTSFSSSRFMALSLQVQHQLAPHVTAFDHAQRLGSLRQRVDLRDVRLKLALLHQVRQLAELVAAGLAEHVVGAHAVPLALRRIRRLDDADQTAAPLQHLEARHL